MGLQVCIEINFHVSKVSSSLSVFLHLSSNKQITTITYLEKKKRAKSGGKIWKIKRRSLFLAHLVSSFCAPIFKSLLFCFCFLLFKRKELKERLLIFMTF